MCNPAGCASQPRPAAAASGSRPRRAYNQAITRVASQRGVAVIDIRAAFDRSAPDGNPIKSRTGDFMRHPNSFGHRVYFSLLLPHFLAAPVLASTLPGFVDLTD